MNETPKAIGTKLI